MPSCSYNRFIHSISAAFLCIYETINACSCHKVAARQESKAMTLSSVMFCCLLLVRNSDMVGGRFVLRFVKATESSTKGTRWSEHVSLTYTAQDKQLG